MLLWNVFERKTNERRNYKKIILKITRHQVIRSLSLFGSVRSLSAVLSSISVLNFSSIAALLFVASLIDPSTVTDPYSRALWAIKRPRVVNTTATVSSRLFHASIFCLVLRCCDVGVAKAIKEKRRTFWQCNIKRFYDEKAAVTGS